MKEFYFFFSFKNVEIAADTIERTLDGKQRIERGAEEE